MKLAIAVMTVLAALAASGCGSDAGDADFLGGIPDGESIRIKLPGDNAAGNALTAAPRTLERAAMTASQVGDTAEFYLFTRKMTQEVNGGVYQLLLMIDDIAHQDPTTKEEGRWIWGPYTPGGLDPASYKVTIEKTGEKTYAWSLETKPKDAGDDAFAQAMGGTHTKGTRPRRGEGTIDLDFDVMASTDTSKVERGKVTVTYQSDVHPVTVDVAFKDFIGEDGKGPADSAYHYLENDGGSGEFSFAIATDIDAKGKVEDAKVVSRWQGDGRGRSDLSFSGGDLADQQLDGIVAVECWDAGFKRTYFEDWVTTADGKIPVDPVQGDAATCAFTDQKSL